MLELHDEDRVEQIRFYCYHSNPNWIRLFSAQFSEIGSFSVIHPTISHGPLMCHGTQVGHHCPTGIMSESSAHC